MKRENETAPKLKKGCGNQSNSACWSAGYSEEYKKYAAMLSFSSACGCWESVYEITRETYEKAGTFEDDDYKTERLIRGGKLLYKYENERNFPEPMEIIKDENYEQLRSMLLGNP